MRGKRLFLLLFALGVLGACTQNPSTPSTPGARLQAALSPSQVEVVGEGEAALTLRVEAQGIPGELQLSLAGGEGFALTPDRLPARSGEHRLALRAPKPQADRQVRLTLRVEGGGKRAELPLEVRHLLPLRAFLEEGGTLLALPRGGEALVHLRVEPRRPLGTALSVRAEAAWLAAEPLAPLPEGGGTVPLRLRVRGDAPLGEANLSLTVLLGGERASVPVQARVVEAPPTPTPDLALSLSPTALSVERGRAGTLTLTLLPQGGFGGEVALRLVGAPQGVALEPASVNVTGANPVTQPLTLRVGQEVPAGTYSLKVRAEAGSLVREASFTLTVTAPAPSPGFTLSGPNPGSLSLRPGESGSFQATLTPQGGFSGQVAFALVRRDTGGPVAGLSLSPTAASLSGSPLTQTFTLAVAGSVAPGAYPLRLRAQGGGVVREADLDLTVTAPAPGPSFTLSLSPTSLSVEQGGSGSLTLTLVPQGGFTGTVSLSLADAPSGVSLSPASLSVSGSAPVTQNLTLSVGSGVPAGTYPLRIRAAGGGLTREASFTLTVTAPAPRPGFTLSLTPQEVALRPGKTESLTLTLTPQGGFQGAVSLSLAGEAQGLSLSPAQVQVAGGGPQRFTLTLSAAPGASLGRRELALKARAEGAGAEGEAPLAATVYTLHLGEVELGQTVVMPFARWREWNIPALGGKATLIRVHLTAQGGPVPLEAPLRGRLEVGPENGPARLVRELDFACPNPLPPATDPDRLDTTCHAILPPELTGDSLFGNDRFLEMRLEVEALDGQRKREALPIRRPFYLNLVLVPVAVDSSEPENEPYHMVFPHPQHVQQIAREAGSYLARFFHVSGVRAQIHAPITYRSRFVNLSSALDAVMELNHRENGSEAGRYVYAAISAVSDWIGPGVAAVDRGPEPHRVPLRGLAVGVGSRNYPVLPETPLWEGFFLTFAHEVGHALDLLHAPGCDNPAFVDLGYPYPDGSLGVPNFNPISRTLVPRSGKDLMSYCSRDGISDYHFRRSYRRPDWEWDYEHPGLESMMAREP